MRFTNKDFFSKYDQIDRKLQIWSPLLKKYLMESFIFCAVNIAILKFNAVDHDCNIRRISKSKAINLMQSINLNKKTRTYCYGFINLLWHIKMGQEILTFHNIEVENHTTILLI